jgi:hypothetical protein
MVLLTPSAYGKLVKQKTKLYFSPFQCPKYSHFVTELKSSLILANIRQKESQGKSLQWESITTTHAGIQLPLM